MGMRDLWLIGDDGSGTAKAGADAVPRVCAVVGVRKVALGELVKRECVCVLKFLDSLFSFRASKILKMIASSDESKPEHCFLIGLERRTQVAASLGQSCPRDHGTEQPSLDSVP